MNSAVIVTDNVAEVLINIIEFTQRRQKVLTQNVNNVHIPDYVPKDLAVGEFSNLMYEAIEEHVCNQRLLLRDSENIKFGPMGSFEAKPVIDECANRLLQKNRDEYLRLQIDKLLENSLNQRIAMELLRQKQGNELRYQVDLN